MTAIHGPAAPMQPQEHAAGAAQAPRTALTSQRAQSWLLELERARWEAQPRYDRPADSGLPQSDVGGQPGADALHAASPGPAAAERIASGVGPAVAPDATIRDARMQAHRSGAQAPARDAPGATMATPAAAAIAPRAAALGAAAQPANDCAMPPGGTPAASDSTAAASPHRAMEWPARSVHAHAGEHSVSVWIRDAGMSPQQALRLLERLRPLLAGTAATPLQLTLNGRAVDRPDRR
jgi:hypothetical protein